MADNSGGIGLLGVIIGAVIVIAIAFFFFGGFGGNNAGGPDINIEAPAPAAPAK